MASLTLLYPVCVSVAGASAVSVDAHHLLYTIHFLDPVHDEFDITTVADVKLYRTVEDALVGGDSDAVDVDVELVGDDLGHIEVHTLAVDALDFDSRGQYYLALCFQEGLGVSQSDDEAAHWYRLAAELGESAAQCNLGICYDRHCNNGHG
jgi:TPR repeat protein